MSTEKTSSTKRLIMAQCVKLGSPEEQSFDLRFWKRAGVQARFEAAWDMVQEVSNWNKKYVRQQRLRRSVSMLKQRKS